MALFRFEGWILDWLTETEDFLFEWDGGNIGKSKIKHGIDPGEVEEMFSGKRRIVPLGVQVAPKTEEERIGVVGVNKNGRVIHLVFTMRGCRVRPISARPAHRKERGLYEKSCQKIKGV